MSIAFQDEVKKSFSRVKKDMIDLKRALNQEKLAAVKMKDGMQGLLSKDEFYSFIKRLGDRLDGIDASIESSLRLEGAIKNLDEKIRGVSGRISRKEDLNAEMKDMRKFKSKFASLESSALDKNRFRSEFEILREKSVDRDFLDKKEKGLKKELNSIRKFVEASIVEVDLGKYATKNDLKKQNSKVDELNSEVARINADMSNVDTRLGSLGAGTGSQEEGARSEIESLSESLGSLREDFDRLNEKAERIQEETINGMGVKIEKGFDELKEMIKAGAGQNDGQDGIIPNIKRGVSVFFKEGEPYSEKRVERGGKQFKAPEMPDEEREKKSQK